MKLFLTLIATSMVTASFAQALTLECKITKYNAEKYSKSVQKSWIPEHQVHILDLEAMTAKYLTKRSVGVVGTVYISNDKRIGWKYIAATEDVNKVPYSSMEFNFLFLQSKNILKTSVRSGGARPIDNIRGTCVERH